MSENETGSESEPIANDTAAELARQAVLNDTAGFDYAEGWRTAAEPDENLPAGEPTGEPTEPAADVVAEPTEPTRHDIPEEVLEELGLSLPEYRERGSEERIVVIREKLETIAGAAAEGEVIRITTLLDSIANDPATSVIAKPENNPAKPTSWRRWFTGLRTLGLSELGRFWARRSIAKINRDAPVEIEAEIAVEREDAAEAVTPTEIAEDSAVQTNKSVRAAKIVAAGITSALSFNYVGSNVARWMIDTFPFGGYLFGAISGVSGQLTGQQASYGLLRWSRNATVFNNNSATAKERQQEAATKRGEARQEVMKNLKSHRLAQFIYWMTNNKAVDYITGVDNRITPAELDEIALNNEDGTENKKGMARLEELFAVLQFEMDRRKNGVGSIDDENDWQHALYIKASTIMANHHNGKGIAQNIIDEQSQRIANRVRGEQRMEKAHNLVSRYIIGPVLGVGLALNAFRAGAHEPAAGPTATPVPTPPPTLPTVEHVPTPVQPEITEYATSQDITSAIESHALSTLVSNPTPEQLQQVQQAILTNNDLDFFGLTHHHLSDLDYAEHALRAQLVEQLAKEQGVTGAAADVWHAADGTVNTSVLQHGHGLTGVHVDHNGHAVFDSLKPEQLTHAHSAVFGDHSFADWRVEQITTVIHDPALRAALHEHLTTVVAAHHNDHNFWLTDHTDHSVNKPALHIESSLRTESDSFVHNWIRAHQPLTTAIGVGEATSKSIKTVAEQPPIETPVLTLSEKFTGAQPETPVITEQPTLIDWWQHGPQLTEHAAADHSLAHQLLPTKDLSETSHQAIDSPSHLAEPASTVRSDAVSVIQSSTLPEPHHVAVDSSSHLATPTDTLRTATSKQVVLETDNAAALETQIFAHPVEAMKPVDAVKPELPAHSLHDYVDTDNKESILIGPNDIGEEIPNEQPSFVP